jgi:hypothetical protein
MIGRVVVMQHYRNDSEHAIEAKYVRLARNFYNIIV